MADERAQPPHNPASIVSRCWCVRPRPRRRAARCSNSRASRRGWMRSRLRWIQGGDLRGHLPACGDQVLDQALRDVEHAFVLGCAPRGTWRAHATLRGRAPGCGARAGTRCTGCWSGSHASAVRPGRVRGRRCRRGRTGLPVPVLDAARQTAWRGPCLSVRQTPWRPAPQRAAACRGRTGSQTRRSSSLPNSHTLGCETTRVTNPPSAFRRSASSSRV